LKATVRFRKSDNVRVKGIFEQIVGYNVIKRYSWTGKSGKEGLFFHTVVQGICFKKHVESLNSCNTIVRQKGLIFPQALSRQFLKN
jgi:hypothetical protein